MKNSNLDEGDLGKMNGVGKDSGLRKYLQGKQRKCKSIE